MTFDDDKSERNNWNEIVLEDLAANWNPRIARIIPKYLYRRISSILHIDELNAFLTETSNDDPLTFLEKAVKFFDLQIKFVGFEKMEMLKDQQNLFIVANHPIGGPEGLALMSRILPIFPEARILIQSMLHAVAPMREISIYNGNMLRSTLEAVKNGSPIVVFPSGYCSRRLSNKKICDPAWMPSFVKLAKRYERTILPIHISGRLGERMYRWYTLRQKLHIQLTVETLYLVDEMFKYKGKELVFTVGDPISDKILTNDVSSEEWASRIRQYVYLLGENATAQFNPALCNTLCLK